MRQDRRDRDPWEGYEFIDINSRGEEAPPRPPREPQRPARRPSSRRGRDKPARGSQKKEPRQGRSQGGRDPRRRPPSQPRRPQGRERPRKPMGKAARRFLLAFTLLAMAAVTAFVCVFLLFKVRTIEVTGDQVYDPSAILELCGYQEGDNLALLTTGEQEAALEEQLPYVEDAQILRHFPSGLEIHITAAQQAACVQSGSQWFIISGKGKILEAATQPLEGVMQITGLTLKDPVVGSTLQVEDASVQQALETILSTLVDLGGVGEFTALDLTDLYNITLSYQDRVLFQLGNTVDLEYKLTYGYGLVTSTDPVHIAQDEYGTLDLTLAGDVKKAYFTESAGSSVSSAAGEDGGSSGAAGDAAGSTSSEDSSSSAADGAEGETGGEESSSTQESGRGSDIPSTIFTG